MGYVGENIPKIDGMAITTGKPVYTDDLADKNSLIIKVLRSPYAFAKIKNIDVKRAEKLEGVECILTYKDVPNVRFTLAGQSYPEPSPYDRLILDDIVRYVGDEVAIIAATDEEIAEKAIKLIKVEYEVFDPILDFEKAIDNKSIIHPEDNLHCNFDIGMKQKKNIVTTKDLEIGDVEKELENCDVVVEETVWTQAQAHSMMETYRAYSYLDHTGRLIVVSSTQIPFHIKRQISQALELPSSKVRVIKPRIGGGFGGKQTGVVEIFAAIVTMKTKKPAKIILSRKETFTATNSRHPMKIKVKLGANKEGFIKAIDIYGLSDTGAYGEHAPTTFNLVGDKTLPLYNKTKAVRFRGEVVYTNKMSSGAFRGYGATQGTFAVETAINKLSKKLNIDPTLIRLKNLIRVGETSLLHEDEKLGSSTLHKCIERGKSLVGWDEKYPCKKISDTRVRGVGMAVTMQGSGIANIDTASAEIRLNEDGKYTLLIGSTDMGTGSDTILTQMAAETLNTNIENITVNASDTDLSPYDPGSYASSTTYVTGMAVVKACKDLKKKILESGANHLECKLEKVEFDGTSIFNLDNDKKISLTKLAELQILGFGGRKQLVGHATHGSDISPPPFMSGFAEVEVDKETGKVDLLNYVSVIDCGKVINPKLATIQAEGGIVQGIGLALFEEVKYTKNGKLSTDSFMQYKIPTRKDFGDIKVEFEESYEPTGPFGAKSIGEVVINTPAPAIVDAIYNAVGVRITDLPITPEKVFLALS
ncbi:xanthine dehydrogenase family protein molybdopterin-binding subunit [Senegalia massiliensis]|jgi:CO/xanthine dehydrogenase Mo-binding subunit|uniref:xanthine dehydrogenase family protein molybdopterin-binding subunit n=1 Tax=Senegalia massiliensis TaxID=1720316 RepID=UPI001030EF8D|nr:molybdopterin cofactor-binding domain-containing protein [Senegalia massiliensis]